MKTFRISQSITDRQDQSLSSYLKEVAKEPLITQEEESQLAKRIKEGDEIALDKLVRANLRFAISVAKQYQNKGLPLVDLIQEANIGLCRAAKSFDESRGFKFISYAVWWIRQSIIYAISNQCRTIKVPMNQIVNMNVINKTSDILEQKLCRKPTSEELGEATGLDSSKINTTLVAITKSSSLDTPFKDEDAGSLVDIIPNRNISDIDSNLIHENTLSEIEKVLNKLPYRERDIIRMVFGINIYPMQIEEVANRFGITCERIRQLLRDCLALIRKKYANDLKPLL
jgi:RNA polymerase primary sigma factor